MVKGRNWVGSVEAAKKIGIGLARLYIWEKYGIVRPKKRQFGIRQFRQYSEEDINRGRFIRVLVDEEGYTVRGAVKKLEAKESEAKR